MSYKGSTSCQHNINKRRKMLLWRTNFKCPYSIPTASGCGQCSESETLRELVDISQSENGGCPQS